MSATTPSFRDEICRQLLARDAVQEMFSDLIYQWSLKNDKSRILGDKAEQVELENQRLRREQDAQLRRALQQGGAVGGSAGNISSSSGGGGGSVGSGGGSGVAASPELELEVERLRSELVAAQKRNAALAQELLDSNTSTRRWQHKASFYEDEIEDWRTNLAKSRKEVAYLLDLCSDKDTTIRVLREELQAAQTTLVNCEEKLKVRRE